MRSTTALRLLGLACVGLLAVPGSAAADTSLPDPPAPAVLAPAVPGSGVAPTAAGVSGQIGSLVDARLGTGSVIVLDAATGAVLFDQRSDRSLIPASTLKLATATAALEVLGPQTRLATVASAYGDVVYLVGGGDPTLVRSGGGNPLAGGSASLRDLAEQVARSFTANSSIRVIYDDSAFEGPRLGPGWPRSFPSAGVVAPVTALVVDGGRVRPGAVSRVSDPALQAAKAFAGFLKAQGLDVTAVRAGTAKPDATEIGRVESPTVEEIVQRMLTDSENNYAEALAHLVGGASAGSPTFAGGAQATEDVLSGLGIDTTGLDLADGSGLSGRNRLTASALAEALHLASGGTDPGLAAIGPGLAVAGLTGTLADRYQTAATRPGRGFVHAKTGTLTGVVSLAGTALARDGRVLVFAMIANRVSSLAGMRDTMDRIASRLATCGCS
ncbi:MAG: D-alanyl-D-alanine carboxypeptidase/D-alanyl-D-alanine-endopeptidase [Actinomycetota bacterium]|nr:D-alanyl-D-alanine carboxypeptidase/D-alanyl-D-alanine-endopeptidase [Actinomycetota bacterium]